MTDKKSETPSTNDLALALSGLSHAYGDTFRLGPLSLAVGRGETVVVLGKNGAGKSTLFNLITGNLDAAAGQVALGGARITPDTPLVKRRLGYLPQDPVLPRWVTPREILRYAAGLHALADASSRVEAALNYWDCLIFAGRPIGTLSYGTQRRVGLALATLHGPELLILDEPHSGLDLFHVRALNDLMTARRRSGLTTLFSTHVAAFAASLSDRAWIVEDGRLRDLDGWRAAGEADRAAALEHCFFPPAAAGAHEAPRA